MKKIEQIKFTNSMNDLENDGWNKLLILTSIILIIVGVIIPIIIISLL